MTQINLKDNQYDGRLISDCISEALLSQDSQSKIISDLQFIEHKKIKDLLKNESKDFFFLANEDKIENEYVFQLSDTSYENCYLQTGNIVGFIGYGDVQVNISSRFTKSDEDIFLHYLLSKVFNINLSELTHEQKRSNIFNFLIFLFPYFLQRAFSKGIFRQYIRNDYNDTNVKGSVNVAQFIKKDIPFLGKIAYSKREYSVDNNLTELVRHTIEFINAGKYKAILRDSNTSSYVKEIVAATKSYNKNHREMIVSKNSKVVRHPYYSEWTDLQKLCLVILNHHKLKYANNNAHKIYGILIDISWLWEEYLNTVLANSDIEGFVHPQNKNNTGKISLFTNGNGARYPDFYSSRYVFDAKYKKFETLTNVSDIGRDDLNQMVTYIHILSNTSSLKDGYFLYPTSNGSKLELPSNEVSGLGGKIGAIGLQIAAEPVAEKPDFDSFAEKMKTNEKNFIERIHQL